jgi:hypothetical protein
MAELIQYNLHPVGVDGRVVAGVHILIGQVSPPGAGHQQLAPDPFIAVNELYFKPGTCGE